MGCGISNQSAKKQKSTVVSVTSEIISKLNLHINLLLSGLHDDNVTIGFLRSGAFSEVMLSFHLPTQQYRALKIIKKDGLVVQDLNPVHKIREMEILEELNHLNVIKPIELFEDKRNFYFFTEYCKGGNLYNRLAKLKTFNETQAAEVMHQLLIVLDYCHKMGVIHRDIKAENILFESETSWEIKLTDFGGFALKLRQQ